MQDVSKVVEKMIMVIHRWSKSGVIDHLLYARDIQFLKIIIVGKPWKMLVKTSYMSKVKLL